jgi:HD superfamily phosphodiesterase
MSIPTLEDAETLLQEGSRLNPGSWVEHSRNVALAAKCIAQDANLEAEKAFVFGLLHDIGRREGVSGIKHILDGYTFLQNLGYIEAACICLTHSFPVKDIRSHVEHRDVSDNESDFIQTFISRLEYDDYDKLLQ